MEKETVILNSAKFLFYKYVKNQMGQSTGCFIRSDTNVLRPYAA